MCGRNYRFWREGVIDCEVEEEDVFNRGGFEQGSCSLCDMFDLKNWKTIIITDWYWNGRSQYKDWAKNDTTFHWYFYQTSASVELFPLR